MTYLLDTVTVSETVKDQPDLAVIRWLLSVDDNRLHVSALTLGEIVSGIERMAVGKRRQRIEGWLNKDFPAWFGDRILAADHVVCRRWGLLKASCPGAPIIDSLIAATALVHNLTLVTRNVRDFAFPGLRVFNPWSK